MASKWHREEIKLLKAMWADHAGDWPFWRTYLPRKSPEQIVRMAANCGLPTDRHGTVRDRTTFTMAEDRRMLQYFGAMEKAGHSPEACAKRYMALSRGES